MVRPGHSHKHTNTLQPNCQESQQYLPAVQAVPVAALRHSHSCRSIAASCSGYIKTIRRRTPWPGTGHRQRCRLPRMWTCKAALLTSILWPCSSTSCRRGLRMWRIAALVVALQEREANHPGVQDQGEHLTRWKLLGGEQAMSSGQAQRRLL